MSLNHEHLETVITNRMGHYNGNVHWLLTNNPDATAERVTEVILDRDSYGAKQLLGGDTEVWVKDREEWYPRLVEAVQAMLDEVRADG